jgi:hypothetical protein
MRWVIIYKKLTGSSSWKKIMDMILRYHRDRQDEKKMDAAGTAEEL